MGQIVENQTALAKSEHVIDAQRQPITIICMARKTQPTSPTRSRRRSKSASRGKSQRKNDRGFRSVAMRVKDHLRAAGLESIQICSDVPGLDVSKIAATHLPVKCKDTEHVFKVRTRMVQAGREVKDDAADNTK